MPVNYLFIILCGFILGIFFIVISKKLALRRSILISKEGMPLIGGIGIGFSFILVTLFVFFLNRSLTKEIIGIIIPAAIIFLFGVIDDWRELSIASKFLVQILAICLLVFFGIRTQIVYIGNLLNMIITFIWILGITNAFNHLDIIDGLTGCSAMIVASSFFIISLLNGDFRTAILALVLIGAIISFLIYNFPPAKIYLGNSGSHFLGFVLAAIALVISYAPLERKVALISPILILGFPIFDTAFLILMRIRQKKPIFKKSNDHLALRFLKMGHSKVKTLLSMFFLCFFFSLCGIAVSQASNQWGIAIIILVFFVSLGLTIKMGKVSING